MPHSFNKIWIHAVWATKERLPIIKPAIEHHLYSFIANQLHELGCPVRIINGMPDHIHCLFLLSPQKSIADVVKQTKGSSSHFINQQNFIAQKFAWQNAMQLFPSVTRVLKRYLITLKIRSNTIRNALFKMNMKHFLNCIRWKPAMMRIFK